MGLSRKSKKELRKLQKHAAKVWESQQVLLGESGKVAREAGHQIARYSREDLAPVAEHLDPVLAGHEGGSHPAAPSGAVSWSSS